VGEPHDRLSRIADRLFDTLEHDPENEADKCVIFLTGETSNCSAIHGYQAGQEIDAMIDVFMHLRAVFRANGKELMLMPLNRG